MPSADPLAARYDALVFDCDGVLYLRDQPVPGAPDVLRRTRALGCQLAFVTNNAATTPGAVAAKLTGFGAPVDPAEVVTSAQATVHLLGGADGLTGTRVLLVGGEGLRGELSRAGAHLLGPDEDWRLAELVVVGLAPDLSYEQLARATLAVAAGARFVRSNPDPSLPTPDGPWPGAGSIAGVVEAAAGRSPETAGKPAPAMFETAAARLGPGTRLMVGDRPDTDLDGAAALGWDTALVLSGVTVQADLPDLVRPPTWLLRDVGGLLDPPGPVLRAPLPGELSTVADLLGLPEPAASSVVAVGADGCLHGAVAWSGRGPDGQLHGPVVREDARRSGTGTRLLVTAATRLRAAGARQLLADVSGADTSGADASGADTSGDGAAAPFLHALGFTRTLDGRWSRPLVTGPAQPD